MNGRYRRGVEAHCRIKRIPEKLFTTTPLEMKHTYRLRVAPRSDPLCLRQRRKRPPTRLSPRPWWRRRRKPRRVPGGSTANLQRSFGSTQLCLLVTPANEGMTWRVVRVFSTIVIVLSAITRSTILMNVSGGFKRSLIALDFFFINTSNVPHFFSTLNF